MIWVSETKFQVRFEAPGQVTSVTPVKLLPVRVTVKVPGTWPVGLILVIVGAAPRSRALTVGLVGAVFRVEL